MKAFTKYKYGGPEVLQLEEVEKPKLKEGHLLVRVKANSVNPADWHIMRGKPILARFAFGLTKPKEPILGADFSGIIEEVGAGVSNFKVGERVFGEQLKAGTYSFFVLPKKGEKWDIIFNSEAKQWGAYKLDRDKDALVIASKTTKIKKVEQLTYSIEGNFIYLDWDTTRLVIKVN